MGVTQYRGIYISLLAMSTTRPRRALTSADLRISRLQSRLSELVEIEVAGPFHMTWYRWSGLSFTEARQWGSHDALGLAFRFASLVASAL